jgi:hypothetical protein
MHAQCVNWSTGISYPHSRACPLIGSFLLGFTYCDVRERESDRNITFRCSSIGYVFFGVSYRDNRERVFMFNYDTKLLLLNILRVYMKIKPLIRYVNILNSINTIIYLYINGGCNYFLYLI